MAKDITLKTRNGETRYPKTVTAIVYENGTGKTLQTIIDEMRQVDADTNTRTQHFKADVSNLDTLKNKTDIGLYNYVGTGWRGSVSVCYDSADNVSQVALSSSTPSYNGNTLTWLSAQPCAMARTYTNGAWTHWEKVGAPVVNDLTTGGTDKALSAEMGKTLKDGLDALGPKCDQIEAENVDSASEVIEVKNDAGTETILSISDEGVDAKNLKSNGQSVLTQHQDISNLATKEELEGKQDAIEEISHDTTTSSDDCIAFTNDEGTEEYAKVDKNGVTAKSLFVKNVQGEYTKMVPPISKISFAGIFTNSPYNLGISDSTDELYYNISTDKLMNGSTEQTIDRTKIYVDPLGNEYVYRDVMRSINPSDAYTHIPDRAFLDLADMVTDFQPSSAYNTPAVIYGLMDALIGTGSDVKIDVGEYLDMTYPAYANGLSASDTTYRRRSGDTNDTPAYRVYMYKISKLPYSPYSKRKMLLFSGEHGNERLAIYDLYVFAYNLLHSTHPLYMYIRSNFDVYIMPMLSVYSVYHDLRVNAVGVNINRNYPTPSWAKAGEGTDNYTGATAGSEFETQMIVGLADVLKPHIVVDHHNYAVGNYQLYVTPVDAEFSGAAAKTVQDCGMAFTKNLPQYFGSNPIIVSQPAYYLYSGGKGQMSSYFYYLGMRSSFLIETGECINFEGGEYSANVSREHYTHVAFEVAEYTLRSMIGYMMEIFTKSYFTKLNY